MKIILQYTLAMFIIVVGLNKFFNFLPECSLLQTSTDTKSIIIGVIEIVLGLLLFFDKKVLVALYIIIVLMAVAIISHLQVGTLDIARAVLGLLSSLFLLFLIKREH